MKNSNGMIEKINWAFFGSSEFSVHVLNELKGLNILPDLIVTTPDQKQGRKLVLTPNVVKVWSNENNIEVIDSDLASNLKFRNYDLFLVASYGKIIKKEVFDLPRRKTLNIHPSLLPKYRGPSPIVSQILNDEKEIGVSIMQIEEGVDTGPVLIQKKIEIGDWPIGRVKLEEILAIMGANLFVEILPTWLSGYLQAVPQDEALATITKKISKEDGLLNLEDDARKNLLKVKAYHGWPGTYFFVEKNGKKVRVIVTDAKIEDGNFKILRVIPEGKKEMNYEDFLRGMKK
jgi:methionyl-tRNA formyltransferase